MKLSSTTIRTILLTGIAICVCFVLLTPAVSQSAEVTLAWDANSDPNLAGYNLYYKTDAGGAPYNGTGAVEGASPITIHLADLANSESPAFTLTGLSDGKVYYFSLTAFNSDGLESDYSNEVSATMGVNPTGTPSGTQSDGNNVPAAPEPVTASKEASTVGPVDLAGDYHLKTQWQVFRSADDVCVLDAVSTSSLTAIRVPEIMLDENSRYYWRARFYDSHDAISGWSKTAYFTTGSFDTDTNGNGIPDDQEVDAAVDMNSDGIPDAEQEIIKSIMVPSCGEPVGLSIENASTVSAILSMDAVDPMELNLSAQDKERVNALPYGLINFKLAVDQPGDTAKVTVYFPETIQNDARWQKYDPIQNTWLDFSDNAQFSDDRKSVTLELVDGGFGDDDGVANGIIIDPSGLEYSSTDGSVSGGGSGVCFITDVMEERTAFPPPMAAGGLLLLLGAGVVMRSGKFSSAAGNTASKTHQK